MEEDRDSDSLPAAAATDVSTSVSVPQAAAMEVPEPEPSRMMVISEGEIQRLKRDLMGLSSSVDRLTQELDGLCTPLVDLSETEDPTITAKSWMKQVRELCYDTGDYLHDVMRSGAEFRIMEARAKNASETFERYNIQSKAPSSSERRRRLLPAPHADLIDHVHKDMVDILMGTEGKLKVVSILGPEGVGKTTLAKRIYRRYFIIIDDLWSAEVWDTVSRAFPHGDCCSRIITTTQTKGVALACCGHQSKQVFTMVPLSFDQSRSLFFRTVFGSESGCPTDLVELSDGIIRKCGGLPLATIHIVSMLPSTLNMQEWTDIRVGYIVRKDDLVKQWVVEGFLDGIEEQGTEEVAGNYFDELVRRGMIQPVNTNKNGKVLSCTLHRMIHDVIVKKSMEENFVITMDYFQSAIPLPDKVRRLSIQFGVATSAHIPDGILVSKVRSLAFFGLFQCLPSNHEYSVLRVLILHISSDQDKGSIDLAGIGELLRLRYLKIACNIIVKLPEEMQGQQYLETLEVEATLSAIPWDIGELSRLCILSFAVTELSSEDICTLQELVALTALSVYMKTPSTECIVVSKGGFCDLKFFTFWCNAPFLMIEENAMPNIQKLKLCFNAHGTRQDGKKPITIRHLPTLQEIYVKIGGTVSDAGSTLEDVVTNHARNPIPVVQLMESREDQEYESLEEQDEIMEEYEHEYTRTEEKGLGERENMEGDTNETQNDGTEKDENKYADSRISMLTGSASRLAVPATIGLIMSLVFTGLVDKALSHMEPAELYDNVSKLAAQIIPQLQLTVEAAESSEDKVFLEKLVRELKSYFNELEETKDDTGPSNQEQCTPWRTISSALSKAFDTMTTNIITVSSSSERFSSLPGPTSGREPLGVVMVYAFDCSERTSAWYAMDNEVFWLVQEKLTRFTGSCLGYIFVMLSSNTYTCDMKVVDSSETRETGYTSFNRHRWITCAKNMACGLPEAHKMISNCAHQNGIILLFSDGLKNKGDFFDGAENFVSKVPVHTFTLDGDASYNQVLHSIADKSPGGKFHHPNPVPDRPSLSTAFSNLLDNILGGGLKDDEKPPNYPTPGRVPLDVVIVYAFDCTNSTRAWHTVDNGVFWLVQEKLTHFPDSCMGYIYVMSTPNTYTTDMKLVDPAETKATGYTGFTRRRMRCTKNMASGLAEAHKMVTNRGHYNGIILFFSDGFINKGDFFDGTDNFISKVPVHTFTLGGDAYNHGLQDITTMSPGGTFNPLPVPERPELSVPFSKLLDSLLGSNMD